MILMKKIMLIIISFLLIYSVGCKNTNSQTNKKELVIFAASSLIDVMNEVIETYKEEYGDVDIKVSYSSSGTLQKQIEQGADADIFISAGVKQMDVLENKNIIEKDTRIDILKNELVLICTNEMKSEINSINDLKKASVESISIGIPETAPVGFYSKESLISLKLWDEIKEKIVYGKNTREVLTYLESENVDAALVYKSDTLKMKNGVIVESIKQEMHSPIVYPMAIIKDCKNIKESKLFIDYMKKDVVKDISEKNGFCLIE